MDKVLMKSVLLQAGLPVGDYLWFTASRWQREREALAKAAEGRFGYPCFVKPANLGSSVGVSKAYDREGLFAAVAEAFRFDRKVLVEKFLPGREIECSVLGNDDPVASLPGEVVPCGDFYDYRAKYLDDRSLLIIPAKLPPELVEKIRNLAVDVFLALDCAGLGRVDFFVDDVVGQVWVNEINTLPGFTSISMYPKMWEASGLPFDALLARLIELARERFAEKARLETSYEAEKKDV
jgi:D-alanine-D-alanine ligase